MLAMLAGLTITLVVLAAAASNPTAQFVSQRENEEEAMYRALQVASAIQSYATLKGGLTPQNLPTKLEDLTQEININARPLHLVRQAAMVDPLTNGDWKPVRLGDPLVRDFLKAFLQDMAKQQAVNMTSGAGAATQQSQEIPALLQLAMQAGGINMASLKSDDESDSQRGSSMSGFSLGSDSESRPIIGVVSRSTKKLIRNYYGIDSYDKALFVSGSQPSNLSFPVMVLGGVPPAGDSGDSGLSPYKGPSFGPCQRTGIRDPRCDGK